MMTFARAGASPAAVMRPDERRRDRSRRKESCSCRLFFLPSFLRFIDFTDMHVAIQTFCRNRIIPIEASCSEECGAWNHHTFRHDALSALFGTGNIRGGSWNRTSALADEAATL